MGYPKDKKPKKTYTLSTFAKKELRKQELGIKDKPIAEKVGEGLGDNTALLNQGLQNVSFFNRPVNTTTFEPPATQQNVTQQPTQQQETTEQPQNNLLLYGQSGLPNSEVSTLLGSVLTGQTQQNLYDNVSHSLNKIKEGAELFDPNVGLTPGNAFAGIKFMNGLAGLSFLPITAVNEVLKQNPVTDWLNKGAMLPFELADELYTLTQKGTDYAFEKITGNKPERNNPLSQELDEFVRTANQLLIGGKTFHETGKFFKKGMPEVKEVKTTGTDEFANKLNEQPEVSKPAEVEKKPYEQPAIIIGEQPKVSPEIDLGNKKQTFTKIINEFDKDLQNIEQKLSSGEITKQEFDALEKQYNETESRKKSWEKRLEDLKEEPKPIETVEENKRPSDDIYSQENIKNPKYPDRTNEVIDPDPVYKTLNKLYEVDDLPTITTEKNIKLSDIKNGVGQQIEDAINNVENGLESKTEGKPLVVESEGKYYIQDGFHRIAKAIINNEDNIVVDIAYKKPKDIAEAYHKAKLTNDNPELIKKTEDILKADTEPYFKTEEGKRLLEQPKTEDAIPETKPIKIVNYRDSFKEKKAPKEEYIDDYGRERKKYSSDAYTEDYMYKNPHTNQKVRWGVELSNGDIVSFDTAIKLTNPEAYDRLASKGLNKAGDKARRELFNLLPEEVKQKIYDDIPYNELIDKSDFNKNGYNTKWNSKFSQWLEDNDHILKGMWTKEGKVYKVIENEILQREFKAESRKQAIEKFKNNPENKDDGTVKEGKIKKVVEIPDIESNNKSSKPLSTPESKLAPESDSKQSATFLKYDNPELEKKIEIDENGYVYENGTRQFSANNYEDGYNFIKNKYPEVIDEFTPPKDKIKNDNEERIVTAEDFEYNPGIMKGLKKEVAIMYNGKIIKSKIGDNGIYNHADLTVKYVPEKDWGKVTSGFITKENKFVKNDLSTIEKPEPPTLTQKKEARKKQLAEKKVVKMTEQEKKTEGALTDIFAYRERVNGLRRSDISGRANRRKNINALKKAVDEFNTYSPDKTAKIEKGKSGNYKITIDGKPLREERVRKEFDVKKEVDNVDNPEANKPFTELGAEERATQIAIAEDLSNVGTKFLKEKGKFETPAKVLKKGIQDIKDDHGKELTPEAIITRDEMLQKSNKENYKERADEILNKADDSDIPADADTSFNFGVNVKKKTEYNSAKQIIKDALKKDSGISFGGLSKLGDLADPKVLKAVYDVAKYHLENGAVKLADWSRKMVKEVGNWIKPHLRNLYNEITKDRTGLDNVVTQGINLNPIKKEVSETFEGAVDKIKRSADTIKKILAPVSRGENAKLTAKIITEKNAELARQEAIMTENFKEARKVFDKRSNAENLKMIDAIESGADINNPIEKSFANEVRKLLDAEYKKVTDRKGVKSFIENYFPHIWERDSQNQLQAMLSRRPFEGSKSFLKKRTIPTTREGIEAGLKPVTYNPVDLALLKLHEMKKFNMAHEIMDNLKAEGLVKYIPADYFAPAGWTKLNDKIGTIFGDPGITATEYVDKHLYNALQKLATDLNIKHSRVAELRGTRMGEASPAGYVNTKYATPEDVLAHEIGHHLQFKYNLWDYLTGDIHVEGRNKTDTLKKTRQERVKIHKELRALADLRAKGEKVSDSHKRYLREKDEKMAVVLQAYTHIPAEMREVAPTIFSKFEKFIDSKPELRQIKQIKPSLVPKGMDMKYDKNGILIKGHYYLPEPATRIINNHLSPGLKGEPIFDIYRGISNTLNQVQLGASLFHASFTSGDANLSKLALGLMKLSRGKTEGILDIATSPFAFITNPIEGNKIRKDYLSDRPNNPELVNAITRAGGRISMDKFYTNDLTGTVKKAFKDGKYISGSLKAPFALFEQLSKPVLEYLVPRQKLGVFSGLAKDILKDEATGKLTKEQATERLQEAWRSVDNRMGQLVYDNLYWDHVVKDIAMASVRSVGWNLGTFRELGGGIRDIPKIITEKRLTPRTAYALALPIGIGLLGAVYSYLNGTPAESIKDLYFPRTGKKNKDGTDDRVSLPSYMKDVYAYSTDIKTAIDTRDLGAGAKTLSHKMHPAISTLLDLVNNHDYFGNEISDNTPFSPEWFVDESKYIAKQFRPFTVTNIAEMNKQGEPLSKQLQSFFGFQLAPGYIRRSNIQNKIYETYQKRNGNGVVSKAESENRDMKRELKDLYSRDRTAYEEKSSDLLEQGKITARQLNSIEDDKPTDIKLFKYLPPDDKIELWNGMTNEEKQRYKDGLNNKVRKTLNIPYKIPSNAPKGILEKATPEEYTEYENEAEKRIAQFEKENKGMDKDELQKERDKIRKDIREEMNLETDKKKTKKHLIIPGRPNPDKESERNSENKQTIKKHLIIPK